MGVASPRKVCGFIAAHDSRAGQKGLRSNPISVVDFYSRGANANTLNALETLAIGARLFCRTESNNDSGADGADDPTHVFHITL